MKPQFSKRLVRLESWFAEVFLLFFWGVEGDRGKLHLRVVIQFTHPCCGKQGEGVSVGSVFEERYIGSKARESLLWWNCYGFGEGDIVTRGIFEDIL